jgi:hypothetical protein
LCLLCMIIVFLSPTEPLETPYSDTGSNNMLAAVLTPRQLARPIGGSVKYNSGSMMAEATHPRCQSKRHHPRQQCLLPQRVLHRGRRLRSGLGPQLWDPGQHRRLLRRASSTPWGCASGHRASGIAPFARAYEDRSRGPGPTDPTQLVAKSHYVEPSPDVLHAGEHSSLDHYR